MSLMDLDLDFYNTEALSYTYTQITWSLSDIPAMIEAEPFDNNINCTRCGVSRKRQGARFCSELSRGGRI